MPWQWISRILNRASSEDSQQDNKPEVNNSSTPPIHNASLAGHEESTIQAAQALESGFFCWLLDCNAAELEVNSDRLRQKVQTILKALDQGAFSVDQLPRRPASFPLLIKLLNSDNASNIDIANTLLSDPALATQTLKTANSPFFRSSHETIDTVERAVFILGSLGIRNIVSATVMMPMIKSNNSKEGILSKKIWEWGLLSAAASDQYSYHQGDSSSPIYLLGLLPALTYLLIYRALQACRETDDTLGEIEACVVKSVIQQRSWQLCHSICQQWGLPPSSNKYLLDAERPSPSESATPLRDGILIGTHKVLQVESNSPIDDKAAFSLIGASNRINKIVVHFLDGKIK